MRAGAAAVALAAAGWIGLAGTALAFPPRPREAPRPPARAVYPFKPSAALRPPEARDALPAFWDDGLRCSVGCRAPGAIAGWPLRPFHRQHALRAGLNERRTASFHVGIDIQAPDLSPVYAIQPGYAHILQRTGNDARVLVGNFIYWHVYPRVREGEYVGAYSTVVGLVIRGEGHLHLSELDDAGRYLNPLRPGGRVVAPWGDTAPPVIGEPEFRADGHVFVRAFDPQSFVTFTSYATPVLAPAALAYRVFDARGRPIGPLEWALRGSQLVAGRPPGRIYTPDAYPAGYQCFAFHAVCRPNWRYRLAGGLAPPLRIGTPGVYRLSVYAWDWAGNTIARDRLFVVQ